VEDARATMAIYKKFDKQIEKEIKNKKYKNIKQQLLDDVKSLSEETT